MKNEEIEKRARHLVAQHWQQVHDLTEVRRPYDKLEIAIAAFGKDCFEAGRKSQFVNGDFADMMEISRFQPKIPQAAAPKTEIVHDIEEQAYDSEGEENLAAAWVRGYRAAKQGG